MISSVSLEGFVSDTNCGKESKGTENLWFETKGRYHESRVIVDRGPGTEGEITVETKREITL